MINLATILRLTRPLVVFDLETTGGNPDLDRIIQIGMTRHHPDREPVSWKTMINPGIRIPPEITKKHHITDEMVDKAPPFKRYALRLATKIMVNCDYAGYNILFDLRTIRTEFQRLKIIWDWTKTDSRVICSLRIYQILHPRTLQDAYKEYVDRQGFEGAHDALHDTAATEAVLARQLERHPEIPRTVPELSDFCFPKDPDWIDRTGRFVWRNNVACIGFGKNSGVPLTELVENKSGYLQWMLGVDFPEDAKMIIRDALRGKFPTRS